MLKASRKVDPPVIYGTRVFTLATGCFTDLMMTTTEGLRLPINTLIAQCFYAHSTQLLIKAAEVLEKKEDVAFYSLLLRQKIKDAFLKEYMTPAAAGLRFGHTNSLCAGPEF